MRGMECVFFKSSPVELTFPETAVPTLEKNEQFPVHPALYRWRPWVVALDRDFVSDSGVSRVLHGWERRMPGDYPETRASLIVRLRLGQSLYELWDEREAANWLVPVYLMEGRKPFEMDDPKYLEFFRGRLQPPPTGWPTGW
jgi:hypothetical protein